MAVLTTTKSTQISRDLVDRLKKWLAVAMPVVTETQDATTGAPITTFSADATPTTGEKIVVIKVIATGSPAALDVFNNAAFQYGPEIIQICTEKNFAGTTDNVADILTAADLLPVFMEAASFNCITEWYQTNNGTAPTAAGITGTPAAKWFPLYFPLSGG